MRKLKIDLSDLLLALENDSYEHKWYLNLKTGEIVLVTEDVSRLIDDFPFEEDEPAEQERVRFAQWVQEECECPAWEKAELPRAYEITYGDPDSFLYIQPSEPREGYRLMVQFTETVLGKPLQEQLWRALDGKGAFRRFKDVLARHPDDQKRWYAFQNERQRESALEWLHDSDIELLEG